MFFFLCVFVVVFDYFLVSMPLRKNKSLRKKKKVGLSLLALNFNLYCLSRLWSYHESLGHTRNLFKFEGRIQIYQKIGEETKNAVNPSQVGPSITCCTAVP